MSPSLAFFVRPASLGFKLPPLTPEAAVRAFDGTSCRILDGRYVSEAFVTQCRELVMGRRVPRLAVVLAGEDPASHVYVGNKEKMFVRAGFASETHRVPSAEATREGLIALVHSLNARDDVDGILVQLPLPGGIAANDVLEAIDPRKDVDGFLLGNIGLLAQGFTSGALPCTPFGVMTLLATYGIPMAGRRAVVVGRSNIVGKPMALLLLGEDATVTVAHSRTRELGAHTREADIVIAAAGKVHLLGEEHFKKGAVVVDVGMHRTDKGKLCGDVDALGATKVCAALTPVPGGVGPMTIAMLLVNTAAAAWTR